MNSNDLKLPEWSRVYGGPILSGCLRQTPADFAVTEVLGFEPDGLGEHDFLWLEKERANTTWVVRQLATFARIPARDVGYCGLKDRHAVTRQWFSVRRPGGGEANWSALDIEGVRLLKTTRNSRKLRRGAHAGNHFVIVTRNLERGLESLDDLVARIGSLGVPNYFGEQRFGRDCRNLPLAEAVLSGKRVTRDKHSIALSAARSWIFNQVLQRRVSDETWARLQKGDIAILDGRGSVFDVEELDKEMMRRCEQLELHPSGPLWGKGGFENPVENEIAAQFANLKAGLEKQTKMSRRALRLAVRDLKMSVKDDALTLEFYLARGGYATAVLREIVNYETMLT